MDERNNEHHLIWASLCDCGVCEDLIGPYDLTAASNQRGICSDCDKLVNPVSKRQRFIIDFEQMSQLLLRGAPASNRNTNMHSRCGCCVENNRSSQRSTRMARQRPHAARNLNRSSVSLYHPRPSNIGSANINGSSACSDADAVSRTSVRTTTGALTSREVAPLPGRLSRGHHCSHCTHRSGMVAFLDSLLSVADSNADLENEAPAPAPVLPDDQPQSLVMSDLVSLVTVRTCESRSQ
ncbi:hypothetical protein Ciccas_013080, partial [Cichlidogyrus casuarinus]